MTRLNLFLFFSILLLSTGYSQTLIINEVSQGPSLSKEYVELLVIPGTGPYQCSSYCLDLRGWIIDDNNGYFSGGPISGSGIAAGAVRFSLDSFWSCIPIGTLIVIYNSGDVNDAIPVNDFSMTDGNCKLILPVTSSLLESQTSSPTTFAPASSLYPITGWSSPPTLWSPLGMSNADDSFQIYNSNNTNVPVFGVSWGNNTFNNIISFSGSATNRVYFFANTIDNNPSNQANWISGTCSAPDNQTPGLPNNAANTNYINLISNNCQPIQPLALSLVGTTPQSCTCDGTATISATGSIAPYTYAWYDNLNIPLGQTLATATNLCSGNYYCIVTSNVGCVDTIPVFVGNNCSNFGTFATATMVQNCLNNQFYNTTWGSLPDQINPSGVLFDGLNYGPFFQNTSTLILRGGEVKTFKNPGANVCGAKLHYTVYPVGNQPANPLFTILDLPFKESCNLGSNSFPTGGPCLNASDQKWAKENYNVDLTAFTPGDYVLEVYYAVPGSYNSTTGCSDTVYVSNNGSNYKAFFQIKPQPIISGSPLALCPGNSTTLTSNINIGNTWSTSSTNQSISVNSSGNYILTVNLNNNCPNLSDSETITVYAAPTLEAGANQTTCGGAGAITLNGVIGGSATGVSWSSPSGSFSSTNSASTTYTPSITSGVVTIILTATGPCPSVQDQLILLVNATPTVNAGNDQTICAGSTVNLSGSYGGSANAISWTAPSGSFSNISNLSPVYTPSISSGSVTLTLTASGPCPSVSDQVIINVTAPTVPTFTQVASICSGGSLSALPTTSNNGIAGTWSPAINNTATTTYTFTPTAGLCATTTTMTITVNAPTVPTFTQVAAICSGGSFTLPTTSNNAITGTWLAAIDNTTTTTYTFTPTAGQCATTATMTVTVNPQTVPTFTQVAAICSGGSLSALPTTSNNSIVGTWSPAINNTATTTYTFTPTSTAAPTCATTTTMTITVNPLTTPTFTQVAAICSGGSITLPTTSNNAITGTWFPAINNTTTTTYTFTPTSTAAPTCANTTTMTITVNPLTTPTFTQVAAICSGGSLSALPTTSNNGIVGTWSPAINNTATTTYTFTPTSTAAPTCATTTTMTITMNPPTTPTFTQVAAICSGGSLSALSTTSNNSIVGTWSPAINNAITTIYTFTPTIGQCASNALITVTVNPTYSVNISQTVCPNQIPYLWNGITFNAPGTQSATLTSVNGCDSIITLTLNVSSTITSTTNLTICQSDLPYLWNGLTFNSAGSQSFNLIATSGCDSIATLNLSVFSPQSTVVSFNICQAELPYIWNGLTFNASGAQTVTLQDINGCDSLSTLDLQVSNTVLSSTAISICPSALPYSWNGLTFLSSGSQTATLQSTGGCDSLATLTLNIFSTYNEIENVTICANETPFNWNGFNFSSSVSQSITLNSINNCDSTVSLNLTVLPIYSVLLDSTICPSQLPFDWNGLTFNSTETQTLNFTAINGCDSSLIMSVQVLANPEIITVTGGGTYCEGDQVQPVLVEVAGVSPYNLLYELNGVGFNVSSSISPISIGTAPGSYSIVQISDDNCVLNSNLGTASIIVNPMPNSPQLSGDTTYCLNYFPDTLVAVGNLNAQFYWYDESTLLNSIETGMFFYPDNIFGETTYYVVQEENGCISPPSAVVITFENCDIVIPSAFTPDNDLVNDTWILAGIDAIFPKNIVTIYNRFGNLLYQSNSGQYEINPWNGTYNNEPMPVGSYYFIIEFNDGVKNGISGTVTIIK